MSGDGTDLIKTSEFSFVKSHTVYDGSNRPVAIYEVWASAPNGTPCTRTRYQYSGATSLITGMIEEASTWNSAWDF